MHEFGIATSSTGPEFYGCDGVIGSRRRASWITNYVEALAKKTSIVPLVFGFDSREGTHRVRYGEVTFGAIDASKYSGSLYYTFCGTLLLSTFFDSRSMVAY